MILVVNVVVAVVVVVVAVVVVAVVVVAVVVVSLLLLLLFWNVVLIFFLNCKVLFLLRNIQLLSDRKRHVVSIWQCQICLFMCSSFKRFFVVHFFFHFLGLCVASKVILMCSLLVHSTSLLGQRSLQKRICAEVVFCSKKIVVTVLAVFLFLVLTTRHYLSFHKFERQYCLLGVFKAFFYLWIVPGVLNYWFNFFFLESSLYVSISDAVFLVTSFSIFDHSVWLI